MLNEILSAELCTRIFLESIRDYHKNDDIDFPEKNPYSASGQREEQLKYLLYKKNWIDSVQWHMEDNIRAPEINPVEGIALKRRIDESNQRRNDTVEKIDEWLLEEISQKKIIPHANARLNSESPAWIIDRISILCLKIYHMEAEVNRKDAAAGHREACSRKLLILKEQLEDLSLCLFELLGDIEKGEKYMKVYRQMKMYNDPQMNPVLYKNAGT